MLKILKYLLPLLVTVVFFGNADRDSYIETDDISNLLCINAEASHSSIDASESELCLPRQVSFGNAQRVQSAPRRTTGMQRNNLEFTKSGKVCNAGLRYVIQKKSIIIHSSLAEPSHILLCLGKLII